MCKLLKRREREEKERKGRERGNKVFLLPFGFPEAGTEGLIFWR